MAKFRKKPVVIEAVQWDGSADHPAVWLVHKSKATGTILGPSVDFDTPTTVIHAIRTLEGWAEVSPGDWIIRGIKDEHYPCKPDIFAATYEPVGECGCRQCLRDRNERIQGYPAESMQMVVCPKCGNKRCPHATNHRLVCTRSNEPGQAGSYYSDHPMLTEQPPATGSPDTGNTQADNGATPENANGN